MLQVEHDPRLTVEPQLIGPDGGRFIWPAIIAGLILGLVATLASGQTYDVKAAGPRYVVTVGEAEKAMTYAEVRQQALDTKQHLVIGVGCMPPPGPWISHSRATMPPWDGIGHWKAPMLIVVKNKGNGSLVWLKNLDPSATTAELKRWLPAEEVRQAPVPFSDAGPSDTPHPQTADAKPEAASSWRWTDEDVPSYMERYSPAKNTQEIAVTNGFDRITPVPRSRLEEKWRVPGGLAGIDGWTSTLYQWAPRREWVGTIQVLNSFGHFQPNRGWKIGYDAGTEFLDVLANADSGEVFEVRKAMKTDRGWQRFVTYRQPQHRPLGYKGPKGLDCHACHSEAGTGKYGVGLVPGGDTVLSVAFDALE